MKLLQLLSKLVQVHSAVTSNILSRIVEPHSFTIFAEEKVEDVAPLLTTLVDLHLSQSQSLNQNQSHNQGKSQSKASSDTTQQLLMHVVLDLHGAASKGSSNASALILL